MKRNKLFITLAMSLLIALATIGFTGCKQKTSQQPGVKIAVNIPLTGPQAAFSGEYAAALKMGIEEGCAKNNIDPALFKLDIQDNQGASKNAATIFQSHKVAGFDAYISGLSTATNAFIAEADKMDASHLLLAFEAFLTKDSQNRFRVLPSYKTEGPKYAEYAKFRKAKRVFMLTMNIAPTEQEFSHFVEPELTKMGMEFKRERFELSTTDYRSLVLKALEFKPDLILINGLSFNILPLVQSLKSLGYINDGNVLCVMDFIDLLYGEKIPTELEGVAFISPPFEIPGVVAGAEEWRARFKQRGGKVPNYVQAYAYDTGRIFVDSYVKSKSIKPAALKAVFPFEGITGKMNLDADRDLVTELGFVKIAADGKRVSIDVKTK